MRQHFTDPEMCIQCSACEMACPVKAIECILGRYCIDYSLCEDCGKCIKDCPTGAVDCYIEVKEIYSQDEQSTWTVLPSE